MLKKIFMHMLAIFFSFVYVIVDFLAIFVLFYFDSVIFLCFFILFFGVMVSNVIVL